MGKEWKTFSSEVKKKARMHTLHYSSTETLTEIIWEKEIKGQQIEKEVNSFSFPRDQVSYVKVIKITKETCYIKKDSLITKGSINQLIHYQNCHGNLCRSRIKHGESYRTIQRANSKTPEEGRWRSLYSKTYYKVIKVMWYWYKNRQINQMNRTQYSEIILSVYVRYIHKDVSTRYTKGQGQSQ